LKEISKRKSSSMKGKNKGDKNGVRKKGVKDKISKSIEKLWKDKKWRAKQIKFLTGRKLPKHSLVTRNRIRRSISRWWKKRK
jgi:hypothetical protein